jgi:DNA-binding NarL/FixJ family response regulator
VSISVRTANEETLKMRDITLRGAAIDHGTPLLRQHTGLTLVVVDDKPAYRAALRSLSLTLGLHVVGECSDGRNAEIAIVDVHPPHLDGIEVIRTLHREIPQMRFIASTGHALDELFDVAMKNGTSAFVLKTDLIQEFHQVIATVVSGHRYVSRSALERLLDRHIERVRPAEEEDKLTSRQLDVVRLVARGFSNKEVANTLDISESTVEKHRAAAMQRLDCQTAADLVQFALNRGLLD